ncbi:MAG: hypothetical protein K1X67_09555 [Fimbriimonadaceae bacterium]|nr:hypothetical protein [Fimbriimonadaceae bacterium]
MAVSLMGKGVKTNTGLRYVYNFPSRHGKTRLYFWLGKGHPKFRVLNDSTASEGFREAYGRLMQGLPPYPGSGSVVKCEVTTTTHARPTCVVETRLSGWPAGSVGDVLDLFEKTSTFKGWRNRAAISNQFDWIKKQPLMKDTPSSRRFGEMPMSRFDSRAIETLLDRKVTTTSVERVNPRTMMSEIQTEVRGSCQKNNMIKWLRGFGKFAVKQGFWPYNFAKDVEREAVKGGGYAMWTDEIWEMMCRRWPLGTKPRLVFDLASYSGQRRSDVRLIGPRHRNAPEPGLPYGSLVVGQAKGDDGRGSFQTAYIPVVDELHDSIEAARAAGILGTLTYIRQDHRDIPYGSAQSFGNMTREWLDEAGIPKGYSLHGLRKLCVCRLIERGCTPHQVMAVTGHQTLKEIDRYAQHYFRDRMKSIVYRNWLEHAATVSAQASKTAGNYPDRAA